MDNSKYTTNDVKKTCERKLDIIFRAGKEFNGWFKSKGKKAVRITIPKGRKQIPPGTYKSMAHQLKLNTNEFDNLLACPLEKGEYEQILSTQAQNSS